MSRRSEIIAPFFVIKIGKQSLLTQQPIALENKVMTKLDETLDLDIIEPVLGHSPWISPMVIAFKENGDLRIYIDIRLDMRHRLDLLKLIKPS